MYLTDRSGTSGISIRAGVFFMLLIGFLAASYDGLNSSSPTFASNPQAQLAQANGATSGGQCEQQYQQCMKTSLSKLGLTDCEKKWKDCVSKKCHASTGEGQIMTPGIAESYKNGAKSSIQSCPKDPDCESACTEFATAKNGIISCCGGGPKRGNQCRKDVRDTIFDKPNCSPQATKLPGGDVPANGAPATPDTPSPCASGNFAGMCGGTPPALTTPAPGSPAGTDQIGKTLGGGTAGPAGGAPQTPPTNNDISNFAREENQTDIRNPETGFPLKNGEPLILNADTKVSTGMTGKETSGVLGNNIPAQSGDRKSVSTFSVPTNGTPVFDLQGNVLAPQTNRFITEGSPVLDSPGNVSGSSGTEAEPFTGDRFESAFCRNSIEPGCNGVIPPQSSYAWYDPRGWFGSSPSAPATPPAGGLGLAEQAGINDIGKNNPAAPPVVPEVSAAPPAPSKEPNLGEPPQDAFGSLPKQTDNNPDAPPPVGTVVPSCSGKSCEYMINADDKAMIDGYKAAGLKCGDAIDGAIVCSGAGTGNAPRNKTGGDVDPNGNKITKQGGQTDTNNGNGNGGGGGSGALSSLMSGLMQGLLKAMSQPQHPPAAPAQACSTDPNIYAQQQQQYQQQLQQYNYQLQQYQYQVQLNAAYGNNNLAPTMPQPVQPTSCSPSTQQQCATQPQQPAASACSKGTWRPTYSGSCIVNWQCSDLGAQLTCTPTTADVGMTLTLNYSCAQGTASGNGFTASGQSGNATTSVVAPPSGTNTATYSLTCSNGSGTSGAQCSVKVTQPSITLVANPAAVHTGGTSQLGWVTAGMQTCVISSPTDTAFTAQNASNTSVSGTATTLSTTTAVSYFLNCQTLAGQTKSASTTITIAP